jgi:hypothetical protein
MFLGKSLHLGKSYENVIPLNGLFSLYFSGWLQIRSILCQTFLKLITFLTMLLK